MVYRLISSKSVIAKIIADLDITENGLRISDIQSWIGEAVEKIGALSTISKQVSGEHGNPIIKIKDYQAALPCDLISLQQVAYSACECGGWLPMRYSTSPFDKWSKKCRTCDSGCDSNCDEECECSTNTQKSEQQYIYKDDEIVRVFIDMNKPLMSHAEALSFLNTNPNTKEVIRNLISAGDIRFNSISKNNDMRYSYDLQYSIKPGYINTNVRDGYLKLAYTSIETDEFGYIMIPDLPSVIEAVYWYVTMKMLYPEYYKGRMRQDIYYNIRNSWNFYRKQAYGELLMPNQDGIESIKNTWNKLYPEQDDHALFYDTTGERQHLYNWN